MLIKNARSPTLDTITMVEQTVEKHSGECTKTELWKRLPKKMMWQTYLLVIEYLISINKVALDRNDHVAYIWNPTLARRLSQRKGI